MLRYFESREAILLELFDHDRKEWTERLAPLPAAGVDADAPVDERCERFASVVTASLAERRVSCDLLSAQAGVLEHNASPEVAAARFKRAAVADVESLAALAPVHLPELGDRAAQLAASTIMTIGVVWTHSRPSRAMLTAYDAGFSLAALGMHSGPTLQEMIATLTTGALTRVRTSA